MNKVRNSMSFYYRVCSCRKKVVTVVSNFKTMIALVSVLPYPLSNRLSTQTQNPNSHNRFPSSFSFLTSFPNKTIVFGRQSHRLQRPIFLRRKWRRQRHGGLPQPPLPRIRLCLGHQTLLVGYLPQLFQ